MLCLTLDPINAAQPGGVGWAYELVTEYLEQAVHFERMAEQEADEEQGVGAGERLFRARGEAGT
jgi:hypothetical protein